MSESPAAPSPEVFFETAHGFHRTAALKSALELDLFTAIHDGTREPGAPEDGVTPAVPATFSLMMLATTPTGDVYTYAEYEQLVKEAGFRRSELHQLSPTYFRVVLAEK